MTYTIWMCCGGFEQEDTREDAISYAAAIMNGDNHTVLAVEGPNGEDLMEAVEEEDRRSSDRFLQRSKEAREKFLGNIEVKGPTGEWWGRIACYSEDFRDREMADMIRTYGPDRVRFVEEQVRRI